MTKKLLMGNAAFAYAALEAGVNVVAGYPGTPSSEVIETIAALRASGAAQDVHVEWSTNEKAALELLAGASMAGARCLFTCKQVGLNVASDALMSLNYVGVKGGLVLFVADDPGPISSQTEQDTRRFAAFAKVPVLDPATPEQGYAMMLHAFDVSEQYGTPVIVRPTTRINHASTFFDVPDAFQARLVPEGGFQRDNKWIIFPRRSYEAHGEINERLPKISAQFSNGPFNPVVQQGMQPVRGIVAGGVSVAYAQDALALFTQSTEEVLLSPSAARQQRNGRDPLAGHAVVPSYRFWQVGTPYPFPEEAALQFVDGLEEIIVFEELDHVLEDELLKLTGRHHLSIVVHGKSDGSVLDRGENSVQDIYERLVRFFELPLGAYRKTVSSASLGKQVEPAERAEQAEQAERASGQTTDQADRIKQNEQTEQAKPPARPPVLCAGCPHRGSFYAVKQALGKRDAVLCGDIGCYTLGNAAPLNAIDTCLCMGAGITMAQGFKVVEPGKKCIAFVGDSTFFASGMTGVANAVYNGHDITVVVLDNSTTAMTGSQPHPGTGATLMGAQSQPIDIESTLRALGVECIERASAFDVEEAIDAAAAAIDYDGPSAVLYTGPCIQLVAPASPVVVDCDTCTGCGVCIRSVGCPALSLQDEKLHVDTGLCTGCGLCVSTCPFGAIGNTE